MRKCPNPDCQKENPDHSRFCRYCGTKLDILHFCPVCGKQVDYSKEQSRPQEMPSVLVDSERPSFRHNPDQVINEPLPPSTKKKRQTGILVGGVLLLLLAAGLGSCLLFPDSWNSSQPDDHPRSEFLAASSASAFRSESVAFSTQDQKNNPEDTAYIYEDHFPTSTLPGGIVYLNDLVQSAEDYMFFVLRTEHLDENTIPDSIILFQNGRMGKWDLYYATDSIRNQFTLSSLYGKSPESIADRLTGLAGSCMSRFAIVLDTQRGFDEYFFYTGSSSNSVTQITSGLIYHTQADGIPLSGFETTLASNESSSDVVFVTLGSVNLEMNPFEEESDVFSVDPSASERDEFRSNLDLASACEAIQLP